MPSCLRYATVSRCIIKVSMPCSLLLKNTFLHGSQCAAVNVAFQVGVRFLMNTVTNCRHYKVISVQIVASY